MSHYYYGYLLQNRTVKSRRSLFNVLITFLYIPKINQPQSLIQKMSGQEDPVTAYPWQISAQDQQGGPGLDKDMKEQANWTQLE
jgi:hypothetical protein